MQHNQDDEYARYAAELYNIEVGEVNSEHLATAKALGKGFPLKMAQAATDTFIGDQHDVVEQYKTRELSHFKYYRTIVEGTTATTFLYVAIKFLDGGVIHFTTPGSFQHGYLEKRKSVPGFCYIRDTVGSIKASCEKLGYLI